MNWENVTIRKIKKNNQRNFLIDAAIKIKQL